MTENSQLCPHQVAIVVDRDFGRKLSKLVDQYHVWIVESSDNTPAIQDGWAKEPRDPSANPLGPGATAFKAALTRPPGPCADAKGRQIGLVWPDQRHLQDPLPRATALEYLLGWHQRLRASDLSPSAPPRSPQRWR